MKTRKMLVLAFSGLVVLTGCETMDLGKVGSMLGSLGGTAGGPLSLETIIAGLKEALTVGTRNTVSQTSKTGGYALNPTIRIPLPQELQTVGSTLRKIGFGSTVDEFEAKMNEAAEQAAAQAAPVFIDAVRQMTFEDAKNILSGADTAATDYFRAKTSARLAEMYRPIVAKYTDQAGAAKAYKGIMDRYSKIPLVPKPQFASLDEYVTGKSINGLFLILAGEEAKIRKDPAARTTELLRQVFGKK